MTRSKIMEKFRFLMSEHFKCDWKYQSKLENFLNDFLLFPENEDLLPGLTRVRALSVSRIGGAFGLDVAPIPFFCILYTEDGALELTFDRFRYSLRKHSIVFLDMSKGFSLNLPQPGQWSFSFLIIEGKDLNLFYRYFYRDKVAGFFLPPMSGIPAKIRAIYDLIQDFPSDDSCYFISHKLLTDIMTALITERGANPVTNEMLPNHVIKTLAYIDAHYTERFTLDDISAFLNVSKFSLSHDFKKHIGKSIMDFACDKCITKAKELLSTTDDSIGEIGYRLGFSSDAHFISVFKKRVGITPLKYRKQHNIHSYNYILID